MRMDFYKTEEKRWTQLLGVVHQVYWCQIEGSYGSV